MAVSFGVTQLDGFVAPAGCVVKSISSRESITNTKYRNGTGTTIRNIPGKVKTTEQTIELTGTAPLSLLVAGEFTANTFKVVRVRNRENNNGEPVSTIVRKKFATHPLPG